VLGCPEVVSCGQLASDGVSWGGGWLVRGKCAVCLIYFFLQIVPCINCKQQFGQSGQVNEPSRTVM